MVVDPGVQTEASGRLGVSWISKHQLTSAYQYRDVRYANREVVQHALDVRLALQIDIGVRMAVARQKRSKPQAIARKIGSDQYCVAHRMIDQVQAPQNEGRQEYLTQRGISLH